MSMGKWIRQVREDRFIKRSDIEHVSSLIAEARGNSEYYISSEDLAEIENGSVPTIHQIYSFAICMKVTCEQLLRLFGIDVHKTGGSGVQPAEADVDAPLLDDPEDDSGLRLNFDAQISLRETYLLGPDPELWGNVPEEVQKKLHPACYRYAFVGFRDDTMADILPPGSLVEIDQEQREVRPGQGKSLWSRPIYLVQHRYGYCCCWCQQDGEELTLVPHPLSHQKAMHFKMPQQALIIGKAVNVWTPAQLDSMLPESMGSYSSPALVPPPKYAPQSFSSGFTDTFELKRTGRSSA